MRDLKSLAVLFLGFMPWLLFLFLSGHTLASLEHAIIISLIASITFGLGELRRGYILAWGTFVFFSLCIVLINLLKLVWFAREMDLLANLALALVMWLTILVGRPFALQYAQRDLPQERWSDPEVIRGCRFITIVWALLMSLAAAVSVVRRMPVVHLPDWVYFDVSIVIILSGLAITTLFKRQKRLQHERLPERQ